MYDLHEFLTPISLSEISNDEAYAEGQLGNHIKVYDDERPDINLADIVIIGIADYRGAGNMTRENNAANTIRQHLYKLHCWHSDVQIADLGNIQTGETLKDTYAALQTVLLDIYDAGKVALIIGGSHDCMLAQYQACSKRKLQVEATCIDALIDLSAEQMRPDRRFLLDMLTGEPNYVRHYNHIGFQSYAVHPKLLETLDKLRFDFYRAGTVSNTLQDMEPVMRNTHIIGFDITAIKHSDAPANTEFPNGLTGVEACTLTRFAGTNNNLRSIGFYGYDPAKDVQELTAAQISQAIWYFIDGRSRCMLDADLEQRDDFNEYHTVFAEVETVFLQSKRTGRWWMQMPNGDFTACSHADYISASTNDIPERWLRIQERSE